VKSPLSLPILFLALGGCGEPDNGSTPATAGTSGNGGSGGAASTSSGGTGGSNGTGGNVAACNDIVLDAPAVGFTYDPGAPPDASGGTIANGTYFLTAQVVYQTPSGIEIPLGRTKVELNDNVWQEVSGDPEPGGVNPDQHTTSTLSTNGTSLSLGRTCPTLAQPETAEYTAEAQTFTIFVLDAGKTVGTVFTRQ